MRLLSALMAAATVLTVFMFLRELFPASRWAWTVGALVLAFQPVFNFIAAGVQSDNLLYLTSALTFFALMRAYRRGLTRGRAAAIGAITAAGLLSKLTSSGCSRGSRWRCCYWCGGPRRMIGAKRCGCSRSPRRSPQSRC